MIKIKRSDTSLQRVLTRLGKISSDYMYSSGAIARGGLQIINKMIEDELGKLRKRNKSR